MVSVFCELEDRALYTILYETATGRRAFTNGWLLDESGLRDTAVEIEHEIELDGTLVTGGSVEVTWSSGRSEKIEFRNQVRNYLAGIGYALEEELRRPGIDIFDLTDPAVVARLDGQNDQGCVFEVGCSDRTRIRRDRSRCAPPVPARVNEPGRAQLGPQCRCGRGRQRGRRPRRGAERARQRARGARPRASRTSRRLDDARRRRDVGAREPVHARRWGPGQRRDSARVPGGADRRGPAGIDPGPQGGVRLQRAEGDRVPRVAGTPLPAHDRVSGLFPRLTRAHPQPGAGSNR